jgi:hypothetical protein
MIAFNLYSQKEAYNWFYGTKLGLTFATPDSFPHDIKNSIWGTDAVSSISDRFGRLQFYTNGDIIFNRNHDTLDIINDTLFALLKRGGVSNNIFSGSTIIIPKPCSENIYYVIHTIGDIPRGTKMELYYTTVDMSEKKGLGAVSDNNKIINKDVIPYTLTATKHYDDKIIWMSFIDKSGLIYFYKISEKGIFYSHCNGQYSAYFQNKKFIGNIKFSANGDKLAISTRQRQILIFDFDNRRGLITNPIIINFSLWSLERAIEPKVSNASGLEFSENSSKLYAYGRQWDLSLADSAAINASEYKFYDSLSFWRDTGFIRTSFVHNYQLAPDGKIYIPWKDSLDVIENPNERGASCSFKAWQHSGPVRIGPNYVEESEALPIFPTHYLRFQVNASFNHDLCSKTNKKITLCEAEPLQFYASEIKNAGYEWTGPDGFYSYQQNPLIANVSKDMTGWFVVKATRRHDEISYDSVFVQVKPLVSTEIYPNGNIEICKYTPFLLEARPLIPNNKYLWSTGSTETSIYITQPGKYYLYITDSVNCTKTDSVIVKYNELKTEIEIIGDQINCDGDSVILRTKDKFSKYFWSTGDTTWEIKLYKSMQCSVEVVDEFGCAGWTEPAYVVFRAVPKTKIKGPLTTCEGSINKYCIIKAIKDSVFWNVSGGNIIQTIGTDTVLVQWTSTGNNKIVVKQVSKTGCPSYDSIEVMIGGAYNPKIIPENPKICSGKSIVLKLEEIYDNYEWSTGETSQEITVSLPGIYTVKVSDNAGCIGYDTTIVEKANDPKPEISGKSFICKDESSLLSLNKKYKYYLWNTGDSTETIDVMSSGVFCVEVTDSNGCTGSDCFEVKQRIIEIEGLTDIKFGNIFFDSKKVVSQRLENKGNDSITISSIRLLNNKFKLITDKKLPIVLARNESVYISLVFEPDYPIQYEDSLIVEIISPCSEIYSYFITGGSYINISIWMNDTEAEVGDSICIPIMGKINSNKTIIISTLFNSEIEFDASSFYNNKFNYKYFGKAEFEIKNSNLNLSNQAKQIAEICGLVLLSDNRINNITIKSFIPENINYEIEIKDAILSINGCAIDISRINILDPITVVMMPNPASEEITMQIKSPLAGTCRIRFFNSLGMEVKNININLISGMNELNFDVSDLVGGIYFVRVSEVVKIIIKE